MENNLAEHVCPVWIGYLLASPIRKLFQNPNKILNPYIKPGMTVLDVGSAMGFFSLPLAKMVKPNGQVICVDLQQEMINALEKKARKVGVSDMIQTIACSQNSLNLSSFVGQIDFVLAFAVLHEVPDQSIFLSELNQTLKTGGSLLLSEPKGHVTKSDFDVSLEIAQKTNFKIVNQPIIPRSISALLEKI